MLTVFTTASGTKFHRSPACRQVKSYSEVMEYTLDMIGDRLPCLTCFRDAPDPRILHAYCPTCNTFRPCEHNGGVLVPLTRTRRSRSPYMEPGETYIRWDYVWPESLTTHVS